MAQTFLNIRGSTPWGVVLVQYPDVQINPQDFDIGHFQRLFMNIAGSDGGLWQYWNEVSFRKVDLNGSVVLGIVTLPKPSTAYGKNDEWTVMSDAAAALWPSRQVRLANLQHFGYRMVFVTNKPHPKLRTCMTGWVFIQAADWSPAILAHEMGHLYGLAHSFDEGPATCGHSPGFDNPGEYCDRHDIMSAMNVEVRAGPLGAIGPGLSVPYLLKFGWLAPARVLRVTTGGTFPRQTIALDPLEDADGTAAAAIRLDYPNPGGGVDIHTVEYRAPYDALIVHRWDTRDLSVLQKNADKSLFKYRERYVDPLNRFQAAIMGYDGDGRAQIEIGPVGPYIYLDAELTKDLRTLIDEDSFHFPPPDAGQTVERLCGSGDFPYKAYARRQQLACNVKQEWIPYGDLDTITWFINGVQLTPQPPSYPSEAPYAIPVGRRYALPAPDGSVQQAATVTVNAGVSNYPGLVLENVPADGNYELLVEVTVRLKSGEELTAEARVEIEGQRLEIYGGWNDFITACNIERMAWFGRLREHQRSPVPLPLVHGNPVLPRNPGDPPPNWMPTLDTLEWCAEHRPAQLEEAVMGALKMHGLGFADALRARSWSDALRWGTAADAEPGAPVK